MIDNPPLYEGEDSFIHAIDDFIIARRKSENNPEQGSRIAEALELYIAQHPNSWLHVCGVSASRNPALNPRSSQLTLINRPSSRARTSDEEPVIHESIISRAPISEF
jgi:hypothetical protein